MLIIDGSHFLSRCRFAAPDIDWRVYCYLTSRTILTTLATLNDSDAVVVWDLNGSYRRVRAYEDYKKKKPIDKTTPEGRREALELTEYSKARTWLHQNLPCMSVQSVQAQGIEGDDIAYWIVKHKVPAHDPRLKRVNYFCTTDRDWCQFITEQWSWYNPMQSKKDEFGAPVNTNLSDKVTTHEDFVKQYGSVERFIFRKALLGDKSDNIPKSMLMGESNVDGYVDKILARESIVNSSAVSKHLQEFIRSGQFTRNLELIDFRMLGRSERRLLNIAYDESINKVTHPTLVDWFKLSNALDSESMMDFGEYLTAANLSETT